MLPNRRTDMTKLRAAFRNIAKAPEERISAATAMGCSRSAKIYQRLVLLVCLAPVKWMFMSGLCARVFH